MPADFYSSAAWRALRARALARDRWCCVVCGASVRAKGQSRVDHIKPRRQYPELALVLANLQTLCSTCDNRKHADKLGHAARYGVAVDGSPLDPSHPWARPSRGP